MHHNVCINRRHFMKLSGAITAALALNACSMPDSPERTVQQPNIILCMCDDLGWGDVGYHGKNGRIKTPNLDAMAENSLQFRRFYAGAPVCSPTRGSAITGRHPYRYGIFSANVGHIKPEEITLAEALRPLGYCTGHFGKWHLGTLTKTIKDGRRGGKPNNDEHYSPPWENGFDECFSTEQSVPTWNPMENQNIPTRYWTGPEQSLPHDDETLKGDDSRVIMDRVIPFIRNAVKQEKPFLSVVWFHAPHKPYVAGPKYKAMYSDLNEDVQNYYGCITAMDEQMGRLRKELRDLGIADNTLLWFTSDNGPENKTPGTTGGFRDRKRSLHEGGVRVPGLLEWPARIKTARITNVPCCTSDYFPTILSALGYTPKDAVEPIDGINLLPLIDGKMEERPVPIAFQSNKQRSLSNNRYKLYSNNSGETYELYDLIEDPYETNDIASAHPETVASMKKILEAWIDSCAKSNKGKDY